MAERALAIAQSTNVKSASFDDESGRITVVFNSGHSGFYSQCDVHVADAFEEAASSGKFVASVLKPGYPYTKIG